MVAIVTDLAREKQYLSPDVGAEAANDADTAQLLALKTLITKHDHAAAIELARQILADSPTNPMVWNALGLALRACRRVQAAISSYRNALTLAPDSASIWSNLGNALVEDRRFAQALAAHERAVSLAPNDAKVVYNYGLALARDGSHAASLEMLNRANSLKPHDPHIVWDRSRAYLHLGDYACGWRDYEARLRTGHLPPRQVPGTLWDGKPYRGKRLLILSEQGFGDAIWIARWLPAVKALGGTLILEARRELIAFFQHQGFADEIIAKGDPLPDSDLHLHQCSLAKYFATSASSISSQPYLRADPARVAKLAPVFAAPRKGLRVGVVWSGSVTFRGNQDRARTLREFLSWLDLPGIELFSLQKGPPEKELESNQPSNIVNMAPHLQDFADTAAALSFLDLVVMTDSAVVHLAGALGRPVWALLGKDAHWLWSPDTDRTRWYETVRLIRPPAWGDWRRVFDMASSDLMRWTASHTAAK